MKTPTALLVLLALAWSDGVIVPGPNSEIYSGGQVALVKYHDGVEQLHFFVVLNSGSSGRAAWLIPLPSAPTVQDGGVLIFEELSRLSVPVRQDYGYYGCEEGLDCDGSYSGAELEYADEYFELIGQRQLAGLTAVVIHTNNADSIKAWLTNNGYTTPADAIALFGEYIAKDWTYFFAAKIDSAAGYYYHAVGVKLTFATSEPIYPMRISSSNSYRNYYGGPLSIPLFLYVIADNKMIFDDAQLKYANDLNGDEVSKIGVDMPVLRSLLAPGDFLTKLAKEYGSAAEMSQDIMLRPAPDNDEYRELLGEGNYYYYGNATLWLIVLYPCYLAYRRVRRLLSRKRRS